MVRWFSSYAAWGFLTLLVPHAVLADALPPSHHSQNDDDETKAEKAADFVDIDVPDNWTSRQWREHSRWLLLGNFSDFDLILPGKTGGTIGYVSSADRTWEIEYLRSKVSVPFLVQDLGSFTERRVSLLPRTFWSTNSFSGYFGIAWNSVELSLGDSTLATLTGKVYPNAELLRVDTIGFNTGIGNRWIIWKGVTLGADWIGWNQGLFVIRSDEGILTNAVNESEKETVKNALKAVAYVPRLYIAKLQLGLTF